MARDKWRVIYVDSEQAGEGDARNAIDGKPETYWHTQWSPNLTKHPHEIRIDLGETLELRGVTYLPRQDGDHGRIGRYAIYVSQDGKTWRRPAAEGRFQISTALQTAVFASPTLGRYIRLVAKSEVHREAWTSVAELSVIATSRKEPKRRPTP